MSFLRTELLTTSRGPQGIMVVGTSARCGKTVACAGLAGALSQLGFRIQAMKPLGFTPKVSITSTRESLFFNKVLLPIEPVETIWAESAHQLTVKHWQRVMELCQRRNYDYLLEAPGQLASPLRYVQGDAFDATDWAQALQTPLLIVTPKQPEVIAVMATAFSYLWRKNASVLGWIAVECAPSSLPYWDADVLYLTQQYQVPYLGEIAYSPSISVEACQQGNLIRTTEMGVDLLPIQQSLQLLVP
jgi:dethiobiotin synthetase